MRNDDIEITNKMHLKEKLEKASGNMFTDLILQLTATCIFGASSVLYFIYNDYRQAIMQTFFLSLIATIVCNCELLNSLKTLKRIRSCKDASASKLISIDRVTLPHFHVAITFMALLSLVILFIRI